ncbi:MAG TPA: RsmB/NOP family class I SAM-dependent RNA methyltransferase [Thermohalobaculum sp.]|nr:RsmB/NOP family class I SAM-dependent RNA methyltransferase [Thermohalobaculum sp.]
MRPAARVAAAIAVLERWQHERAGLDRVLAAWGRENRFAGAKDRRAIADLAYDAVRRWRSACWVAGGDEGPRAAVIGSLRLDEIDPATLFTGEGHAPPPLTASEASARPLSAAPRAVGLDLPDWLMPELADVPDAALLLLRRRAPVDLRVNLLKTDPASARARLAAEGIAVEPGPLSPTCLRVTGGARRVGASGAYAEGLVELQDAASQAVAERAGAQPGETVLDFCAGGGGKTLALAAAMGNRGRLIAHDASPARLEQLCPRARRAGARVEVLEPGGWSALEAAADLTLVDAPCSGSGAWRRNPDARWRLDPARLEELLALQDRVLGEAATTVRPGGRLVYATCSLIRRENDGRMRRFLDRHPWFSPSGSALALTPLDGGDGFYASVLTRQY